MNTKDQDLSSNQNNQTQACTSIDMEICELLQQNGGVDLLNVNLADKSPITSRAIIVSGTSARHCNTLAEKSIELLKKYKIIPKVDGLQTAQWVAIDAGQLVIHVFLPEVRAYYKIEQIWGLETPTAATN